jgi:signal peptidase
MKFLNILGTIVVIALIAIAVYLFISPETGWRVDTVLSGSMEPHLKVGGVVVTRPVDTAEIKKGEIITFFSPLNSKLTSHRVVDIEPTTPLRFWTKGDANEEGDPFIVMEENLAGKVFLHIPYFGYVTTFLKSFLGMVLTLCVPALIVIILELRNIWKACRGDYYERDYRW